MQKVTVQSPANIAFIKYWGQTKHNLFIPRNDNISMTLSGCITTTTVERSPDITKDTIEVRTKNGTYELLSQNSTKGKKAYEQIERIRKMAGSTDHVAVKSENSFPSDAGIASSASGFSALTGALLISFGKKDMFDNKKEFSKEVRLCGSASAARSVYGGFVELHGGNSHDEAFAEQLANEHYWNLVDIIATVDDDKKKTSSSAGHAAADSSPYYQSPVQVIQPRIDRTIQAIQDKNIKLLGPCIEEDTISMHMVMMTSVPPAYYWQPGTLAVMQDVMHLRNDEHIEVYFSIDAGANVHVICEKKDAAIIENALKQNKLVQSIIYNEPCEGTKQINTHLF